MMPWKGDEEREREISSEEIRILFVVAVKVNELMSFFMLSSFLFHYHIFSESCDRI